MFKLNKKGKGAASITELREKIIDNKPKYVYLNLKDYAYVVLNGFSENVGYKFLGVGTNADAIKEIIDSYHHGSLITKGKVIERYGKKALFEKAFYGEKKNPHYACAPPMQLYNKDVIVYYLKNQ